MRENALGTVEGDYTREVSPFNLSTFSLCYPTCFVLLSPYFIPTIHGQDMFLSE